MNNSIRVNKSEIAPCAMCGKSIDFIKYSRDDYVYKHTSTGRIKYFCSYSCKRKFEAGRGKR